MTDADQPEDRPGGAPPPAPPSDTPRETAASPAADGEFARMLEGSVDARSFQEGETVEGTIVALQRDVAFLDIGGKSEATIDLEELRGEDGNLEAQPGDSIEAIVVGTSGGLKLSRRLARGAAAREQVAAAYEAGLPVEGKVVRAVKGGYEVRVAGLRGFCPYSQIDLRRSSDPVSHEGRVHTFRIVEFKDGGKDLVLSRRAILEVEEREKAERLRASIVPGAVLPGHVASVREYGAFVELGAGIQGLLHVSEMSWGRVASPADVMRPGDAITVKVLRLDEDGKKISLGLKQLQADPWATAGERYAVGRTYQGTVSRLADFGAFVELEPGVEALAHVSTFPPTGDPAGWKASVAPGTAAAFEVVSVDPARRRIGVALAQEGSSRAEAIPAKRDGKAEIVPGARLKGKVERHERFGVFVYLAPGRTGLMPVSETGTARGTDLRKAFPVGSEVEVAVLEVEPSGRKIRLSRKAIHDAEERSDTRAYQERQAPQSSDAFGSLADKLKAALEKPR